MKNKIWLAGNLFTLAVIAFFAFGEHSKAQKKDVWEYKVEGISLNQTDRPEAFLNKTGADGWELVSVNEIPNQLTPILIYKRKK